MSNISVITIGERFGRYTILREVEQSQGRRRVLCQCDCGREGIVRLYSLKGGDVKSCGCLKKENSSKIHKTHGYSRTKVYETWSKMCRRCTDNANEREKRYYFNRGIRVCERWQTFVNFLADMGDKPPGTELDRINSCGNYEPSNCRWVTRKVNMRNKSSNVILTLNGESKTIIGWAESIGVNPKLLHGRRLRGWSDERILTEPIYNRGQNKPVHQYENLQGGA